VLDASEAGPASLASSTRTKEDNVVISSKQSLTKQNHCLFFCLYGYGKVQAKRKASMSRKAQGIPAKPLLPTL